MSHTAIQVDHPLVPGGTSQTGLPVQPWVMDAYAPTGARRLHHRRPREARHRTPRRNRPRHDRTGSHHRHRPVEHQDRHLLAYLHLADRSDHHPPRRADRRLRLLPRPRPPRDARPSSSCPTSPTTPATSAASSSPTARKERHEQHRHAVRPGTRAGWRRSPVREPRPPCVDRGRLVGHRPRRRPRSSPPPRSSRPRRAPSPARSCVGSRWAGRCWPCCRFGSPTSHNAGRRLPAAVHGTGRSAPDGVRLLGARGAQLDLATRPAGARRLDGHRRPPAASQPGRRWLLYPVLAVLASRVVGGGYETVREAVDATAYPMPGQLVDVGGHRLHLHCTGSGSPTVVLEPGGGAMSSNLGWITPAVARDTRVCVYDRAGRGWSDPPTPPRTAPRSPPTCIPCCTARTSPAPTCWRDIPSAASTCSPSPPATPTRSPGMVLVDSTAPAAATGPGHRIA